MGEAWTTSFPLDRGPAKRGRGIPSDSACTPPGSQMIKSANRFTIIAFAFSTAELLLAQERMRPGWWENTMTSGGRSAPPKPLSDGERVIDNLWLDRSDPAIHGESLCEVEQRNLHP
jgi:hypothetical protein